MENVLQMRRDKLVVFCCLQKAELRQLMYSLKLPKSKDNNQSNDTTHLVA